MKTTVMTVNFLALSLLTAAAWAQTPAAQDQQRDVNQQQRIANGMASGSLTNKETGSLERGQAHVSGREANAAKNGHVGAAAQGRIQHAENRQSGRVYRKKHNTVTK